MKQRVAKRKSQETVDSPFAFIADVEGNPSLSIEQKMDVIIKSLYHVKSQEIDDIEYPNWVAKRETKSLLKVLNIKPCDDFIFIDIQKSNPEQFDIQSRFKNFLHDMIYLYRDGSFAEMSIAFETNKTLL